MWSGFYPQVTFIQEVASWAWTKENLILSCNVPTHDNQSASWLDEPFIYLTLKSWVGFSLINTWCGLCQTPGKHIFKWLFGLLQSETFYYIKSNGISSWPKQLKDTQVQLQHRLFDVAADFYWQGILGCLLGEVLSQDLSNLHMLRHLKLLCWWYQMLQYVQGHHKNGTFFVELSQAVTKY